uniref:AlNc14C260G9794 protein n=1 Tax=Albugo laibachii Nc14 TaxID=890382 RepID=F0WTX1_9STRA|nr:AlNc14C260G9794 [Albugo laibachii Nc14]|eukprot:CCA24815.1 AlNc14C260G9794 [Albugo laibachii Nc14]
MERLEHLLVLYCITLISSAFSLSITLSTTTTTTTTTTTKTTKTTTLYHGLFKILIVALMVSNTQQQAGKIEQAGNTSPPGSLPVNKQKLNCRALPKLVGEVSPCAHSNTWNTNPGMQCKEFLKRQIPEIMKKTTKPGSTPQKLTLQNIRDFVFPQFSIEMQYKHDILNKNTEDVQKYVHLVYEEMLRALPEHWRSIQFYVNMKTDKVLTLHPQFLNTYSLYMIYKCKHPKNLSLRSLRTLPSH